MEDKSPNRQRPPTNLMPIPPPPHPMLDTTSSANQSTEGRFQMMPLGLVEGFLYSSEIASTQCNSCFLPACTQTPEILKPLRNLIHCNTHTHTHTTVTIAVVNKTKIGVYFTRIFNLFFYSKMFNSMC